VVTARHPCGLNVIFRVSGLGQHLPHPHEGEGECDKNQEYTGSATPYTLENEEELKLRYAHLGMRDSWFLRLDTLCLAEAPQQSESLVAAGNDPEPGQSVPSVQSTAAEDQTEDESLENTHQLSGVSLGPKP